MAGSIGRLTSAIPLHLKRSMNQVMTQKTVWKNVDITRLKTDLGNGIVADLFPGGVENNSKVYVSDGKSNYSKEVPYSWLKNWLIEKVDKK